MRFIAPLILLALAGASAPAAGQIVADTRNGFRQLPDDPRLRVPISYPKRLEYGEKHWQEIQYFAAKGEAPAPLVVFFSGISPWARYRLNQEGYSIAVITYGEATPKVDAYYDNAVSALAFLKGRADELAFDPARIAFMGWGGGANDAVLFGTDPSLVERAGISFSSVKAVVVVGGVGFDIPRRISENQDQKAQYTRFYGEDPTVQRRWSAVAHLDAPNAPAFMMMAAKDSGEARTQTLEMTGALTNAGIAAQFVELPKTRQNSINTYFLAQADKGSGSELLPFLRSALAR